MVPQTKNTASPWWRLLRCTPRLRLPPVCWQRSLLSYSGHSSAPSVQDCDAYALSGIAAHPHLRVILGQLIYFDEEGTGRVLAHTGGCAAHSGGRAGNSAVHWAQP